MKSYSYTEEFLDIVERFQKLQNREVPKFDVFNVMKVIQEKKAKDKTAKVAIIESLKSKKETRLVTNKETYMQYFAEMRKKKWRPEASSKPSILTSMNKLKIVSRNKQIVDQTIENCSTLPNFKIVMTSRAGNLKQKRRKANMMVRNIESREFLVTTFQKECIQEKLKFSKLSDNLKLKFRKPIDIQIE